MRLRSDIHTKKESKTQSDYLPAKGRISIAYILLAVFVFLVANIVAFGYINYQNYLKHFRNDIKSQLATIANLKSSEISQYIGERIGDGNMLFKRHFFYDTVRRFLEHPEDVENTAFLRDWLGRYANNYQYTGIGLTDTQGVMRMSIPDAGGKIFCSSILKHLPETLNANHVQVGDFCRSDYDNRIYLPILVPILDEDKNNPPIGVLILRIDPETYLYPFIKSWPVPSETAETLLVRREGDEVLYLNELKFRKNSALNLRFPIDSNKDLPAVKAVLGQAGIVEGRDYRGVPVVAYLRAVAGSPWFLVARLDLSEAYEPMRRQLWYTVSLVIASTVAIGAIIWFVWRRQNLIFYRAQYLSAEALKESEERYRRLFEATSDGVLLIDFDTGLILDANPFLIDLLGCSKQGLLKKYFWDIGAFKNIAASKDGFAGLLAKGHVYYEDQPIKAKGGKIVNIELTGNVYLAGSRKIVQCNIRDVTKRRQAEKELARAKETQYRTLIENLPQKVFLKDRNSVYISCNNNYAKDLNIKPEECAGKTDYDFFPTYLAEKYREDDKRVMESGKTENIEEEYVVIKDFLRGAQKSIINTVKVPACDKDGNVTGLFGLFWDITEHKKIEDDLKASEEKFKIIFNGAIDGILLVDLDNKKFLIGNKAICDMLGYTQEEIKNLTIMDIHPEKDLPYIIDVFKKQVHRETSMAANIPVRRKDDSIFYADISSSPIEISGKKYLAGFFRDITKSRLVEAEKKRLSDMKIATEIKSKFTSMVSHELRSPMSVIKESINIILDGLVGSVTPEQKDVLDTAKNNIDRLGRLINNVLDFQKMKDGKMELDIKDNNINEIVLATSKEMNLLAEEKGLSFVVNIDESILGIKFDRDKIVQVLTNLVSNAIKFTEKGGISINTKCEDNMVHVTVEDTGPGIQAEDMHRLFQTFEQLAGGAGKKRGGTGLGLAISKEIIQAHNGKIWAESQFGKSSIFHFTLPIKERRG